MLIKYGSRGPAVRKLIDDLRRLGFVLPRDDVFDLTVKRSVEAFQVGNVDASGMPLEVDGKVGQNTRWAIDAALGGLSPQTATFDPPGIPAGGSTAGRAALKAALHEAALGHGEVGGNNTGPHVLKYLGDPKLDGASWCAGFVSWCFKEGLGKAPVFGHIVGAQALHDRMKTLGHAYQASLANPPQPGDIITWRRIDPGKPKKTAWYGHIGIVHSFADGMLWTVEGNRGPYKSKVKTFRYSWATLVSSATNDRFKGLFGLSRHP